MEIIKIKGNYIQLSKFLKFVGEVSTGGEVAFLIENKAVKINGKEAQFKREKLINNAIVKINEKTYQIKTEK